MESSPCGFHFPLKTIILSINLVIFGRISLRGAEYVLSLFNGFLKGGIPSYAVIQNWILRLGLFKLRQEPERRDDWVFILDHTIEFGTKKCLLVLGIPLAHFRKIGFKIRHCDVTVLAIDIVKKASAASVTDSLENIVLTTGIPIQIISDKGSNIKNGVRDFIENHKEYIIRQTHDVTHRAALILKHHLNGNTRWQSFIGIVASAKRNMVHTVLAYLAPPKPKEKARWLNLDTYISWVEKIMCLEIENIDEGGKKKINFILQCVRKFRTDIKEWETMLDMVEILKDEVKSNGFSERTKENYLKRIASLELNTEKLVSIKNEILEYITEECEGIEGVYPGCSDIIESVFGRYKQFSVRSPMKEIGKSVLTMPIFTSKLNAREVKDAMESVFAEDVKEWLDENIGESLFAKRKKAFSLESTKCSVKKNPEKLEKVANF